jgi:23S rRNA pseudouridine1911/1915/1917 synthase
MSVDTITTIEHTVKVPPQCRGQRLDKVLSGLCPDLSRSRIKALMLDQCVLTGQTPFVDPSYAVVGGESFTLLIPPAVDDTPRPENIPLNIVYEDDQLLVLDKPAGLVVHPGAGHQTGTLVNALLYHCEDTLSGIGGVKRPGIVHRLDQDTSGLMMVAKTDVAHQSLSEQLSSRALKRVYHALVLGVPVPLAGVIDKPIGRHPKNRLRQAVLRKDGREAKTNYKVIENFEDEFSLVECRLQTGRTHQIRVHMQERGHCVLGDPQYGPQRTAFYAGFKRGGYDVDVAKLAEETLTRQALHAVEISFVHPTTEEQMTFKSKVAPEIQSMIDMLSKK